MKEDTYYSKNRERLLQQSKEYRERNKQYYNAYYETWYKKNKDAVNTKRNEQRRLKPKPVRIKPVKEQTLQEIFPVFVQETEIEPEPVSVIDPERFTVKFD